LYFFFWKKSNFLGISYFDLHANDPLKDMTNCLNVDFFSRKLCSTRNEHFYVSTINFQSSFCRPCEKTSYSFHGYSACKNKQQNKMQYFIYLVNQIYLQILTNMSINKNHSFYLQFFTSIIGLIECIKKVIFGLKFTTKILA